MRVFRACCEVLFGIAALLPGPARGQDDSLMLQIERAIEPALGRVGVAVKVLDGGPVLAIEGDQPFPMQSVYKFPLALAVLSRVDQGTLDLDQTVHLTKSDLLPETWSPLRDTYPGGNIDVTLDELLRSTVSLSDNNGCDMLFRLIGGPAAVDAYVRSLGIDDMAIVATEEEMHRAWDVQFRNWSSPLAMARLLETFLLGGILSEESKAYLFQLMVNASSRSRGLRTRLPEGAVVARKTGSSGTNEHGIAAATNDAGIVELPDGRRAIIVVFVSNSPADEPTRNRVIADVARAVWDASAPQE